MHITIEVDEEAKALYFRLREGEIAETVEYPEVEEIFLDLDDQGQVLGIEVLDPGSIDMQSVFADYPSVTILLILVRCSANRLWNWWLDS